MPVVVMGCLWLGFRVEGCLWWLAATVVLLCEQLCLSKQVWESTCSEDWAVILPWTVNMLPYLPQRVRYLRSLLWAMPENAQLIGRMVALGVDGVQWLRITNHIPELVPRGAHSWRRFY